VTVQILNNFIAQEQMDKINTLMTPIVRETPRPNVFSALGWQSASAASRVGFEDRPPMDTKDSDITTTLRECLSEMRKFYGVEDLVLVNALYTVMKAGSSVEMHCDNCQLDGSPLDPSVEVEPNEWSAILYLNTNGVDFEGGEIYFPKQELTYSPVAGDFIHFKTDVDHPHQVLEVTSGDRACLVVFTGRKEVIEKVEADFSSR
jgi:hypothetical protein